MKRAKAFLAALLLSVVGITSLNVGQVLAATCTWTGATNDNFNTSSNWSGCGSGVPQTGDSITFNVASLTDYKTLNNDISSLSVSTVTFTGTNANSYNYEITGNAMTITGGVVANAPGSFKVPLTLGASQTWSGSSYITVGTFVAPKNITMGSSNLTVTAAALYANSVLSGSGNLIVDSEVTLSQSSPSWTGNTSVGANDSILIDKANSLGSTGTITIASTGTLALCGLNGATVQNPISVGGTGAGFGAIIAATGCAGGGGSGDTSAAKAILSGAVTLTSNTTVAAQNELKLTGALSGDYTISMAAGAAGTLVIDSSNNTSKTPNGTSEAAAETITVEKGDDQPNTAVTIGNNQIYIINGVRGDTTVGVGGILKGTGTVGALTVLGKVAPGLSPGCLSSGNLILQPDSIYEIELGGKEACSGYDQLKVTGTVQVGGNLSLSLFNGFKPAQGQTYTIVDNDGSDAVTSTFTNLAEGATFTVNGYVFKISYIGGSGNDVTLTVMNVPATPDTGFGNLQVNPWTSALAMVVAGGALLILARRFKPATATRRKR